MTPSEEIIVNVFVQVIDEGLAHAEDNILCDYTTCWCMKELWPYYEAMKRLEMTREEWDKAAEGSWSLDGPIKEALIGRGITGIFGPDTVWIETFTRGLFSKSTIDGEFW